MPGQIFPDVSRREKDRTLLHFIMRLTSSFLPINYHGGKTAGGAPWRDEKESTSGRNFAQCANPGIEGEHKQPADGRDVDRTRNIAYTGR